MAFDNERNIGTNTDSQMQNLNEKSHIEGKTLRQQSFVKGEEKSWNPIRALDPSCGAWGKTSHSWLGFGQQSLQPQRRNWNWIYFPCFPPASPPACVYQKNKVGCGFEASTLIGIPGENLIWGEEAVFLVGSFCCALLTVPRKVALQRVGQTDTVKYHFLLS